MIVSPLPGINRYLDFLQDISDLKRYDFYGMFFLSKVWARLWSLGDILSRKVDSVFSTEIKIRHYKLFWNHRHLLFLMDFFSPRFLQPKTEGYHPVWCLRHPDYPADQRTWSNTVCNFLPYISQTCPWYSIGWWIACVACKKHPLLFGVNIIDNKYRNLLLK